VVEIVTVTVDDAHDGVRQREHVLRRPLSFTLNGKIPAARRQQQAERRATNAHDKLRVRGTPHRSAVRISHIEGRKCSPVKRLLYHEHDQNDDQEQCHQADGYDLVGLLHILHDVIRESIELLIRHAHVAIAPCQLSLLLLK